MRTEDISCLQTNPTGKTASAPIPNLPSVKGSAETILSTEENHLDFSLIIMTDEEIVNEREFSFSGQCPSGSWRMRLR